MTSIHLPNINFLQRQSISQISTFHNVIYSLNINFSQCQFILQTLTFSRRQSISKTSTFHNVNSSFKYQLFITSIYSPNSNFFMISIYFPNIHFSGTSRCSPVYSNISFSRRQFILQYRLFTTLIHPSNISFSRY